MLKRGRDPYNVLILPPNFKEEKTKPKEVKLVIKVTQRASKRPAKNPALILFQSRPWPYSTASD